MIPSPTRRHLLGGLAAAAMGGLLRPAPARAAGLPAPAGPVILTITGAISADHADGAAALDLAMLDALPQRETLTSTPWHEGPHAFSGPTIASILDLVGAEGTNLRLRALNDYAADMPVDDARTIPVILATRLDGAEIPVRNQGPLFDIYPFDERPELFNEVFFSRSVWQGAGIEVIA